MTHQPSLHDLVITRCSSAPPGGCWFVIGVGWSSVGRWTGMALLCHSRRAAGARAQTSGLRVWGGCHEFGLFALYLVSSV
jgi:hypothetical protein